MEVSPTLRSKAIKQERLNKNLPVYDAGLGESPMPPSKTILDSIQKHKHHNSYTSIKGTPELKLLLGNNLVTGNGSKELLFIIQSAFKKTFPGRKVVYILPAWVSYMEQSNLIGLDSVTLKAKKDKNYKIEPAQLDECLSELDKPLVLFNNPTNPTGVVYSAEEVDNLVVVLENHGAMVLNDEIYDQLLHNDTDFSNIKDRYGKCISSNSFSKTFGCGGYRFGWAVFPEEMDEDMENLYRATQCIASFVYSCPTDFFQYVAADLLKYPNDVKSNIKFQTDMFTQIRKYIVEELEKTKIEYSRPGAAWYIWLDFENYRECLVKLNIKTSSDLTEYLANNYGVIMVPGSAFGDDGLTMRMSYVDIVILSVDSLPARYNYKKIKQLMVVLKQFLDDI